MAEMVACLHQGKVEVLSHGQGSQRLRSPSQEQRAASRAGQADTRIVSVTRGRTSGELCYALSSPSASDVFAQVPGSGREQQLFHGPGTQLSELDFSVADEALACTVSGERGTSAIGVLRDDGRGLRTVTEGDVIDRAPRWVPGGREEIVYASAGIGRTKTGRAVGRSPFALHRLRFSDNSVEVLMTDAQYDYVAVVSVSESLLYALRRSYDRTLPRSPLSRLSSAFRGIFSSSAGAFEQRAVHGHELVRITSKGSQLVAQGVLAFDVAANEDIVYSDAAGVFRITARETTPEPLLVLKRVEQLVIYW
ncbi:MAG TPA: hypothetical protein VJV79_25580 [Polyangiaceae bacterium]|nr:hypothetical protein [Polyangiaceae bacterium]